MSKSHTEKRHVALLVEDEPEMAEEVGELLDSLGYDHIHAATKKRAMELVDEGGFCFVLLDLQIRLNEDSIKPRVEAGQALLEVIRDKYPGHRQDRSSGQSSYMQILVMSGHAKEHHYVVKAFQDGANDFLVKPLSDNKHSFGDTLGEALRKSGREDHSQCSVATRLALGGVPQGLAVGAPTIKLELTHRVKGKRIEVLLDGRAALLTNAAFS